MKFLATLLKSVHTLHILPKRYDGGKFCIDFDNATPKAYVI